MDALATLGDPTRRRILELLSQGERSAGELARNFAMSGAAVSQHLGSLRSARLVAVRRDAQRRIYRIDLDGFAPLDAWLRTVRGPPGRTVAIPAMKPAHDLLRGAFYDAGSGGLP